MNSDELALVRRILGRELTPDETKHYSSMAEIDDTVEAVAARLAAKDPMVAFKYLRDRVPPSEVRRAVLCQCTTPGSHRKTWGNDASSWAKRHHAHTPKAVR